MTPIFVDAVKAGKMKAGPVLSKNGGGMVDLLDDLLVRNDDGPKSGIPGLSDRAYRLGEEIRISDEWLTLAKATAETQRLRAGTKQPESSPARNSGKTAQAAQNKRTGRPRKDEERELVRTLKAGGMSWKDIAAKLNTETGQNKSPEAYRALLRSGSPNTKPRTGKNGQK